MVISDAGDHLYFDITMAHVNGDAEKEGNSGFLESRAPLRVLGGW